MSITAKPNRNVDLTWFPGEIPTEYLYTLGIAGEEVFRAIKDKGKFLASRCETCGVTYFPARIFCERCLSHLSGFFEIQPEGEVYSFTVCRRNRDGSRKEKPDIIAAVKLDQAEGQFVHYLVGVDPSEARIGMRVKAVFKNKNERTGSIFDIKGFQPLK